MATNAATTTATIPAAGVEPQRGAQTAQQNGGRHPRERAFERDRAVGASGNRAQRGDEVGAAAVGLADLGRDRVEGRGGERSGERQREELRVAGRGGEDRGESGNGGLRQGVAGPAAAPLLLRDAGGRLARIPELRGGRAENEEGEEQRERRRSGEGPDRRAEERPDRRSGASHPAGRVGGDRQSDVHRETDEEAPAKVGRVHHAPLSLGEREAEEHDPGDQGHTEIVVEAQGLRFERRREERSGKGDRDRETGAIDTRSAPQQEDRRREPPEEDERQRPSPALGGVPRQLAAPDRHAHDRGHAVAEGEDSPGRRRHFEVAREDQDQQQDGDRIEHDSEREATLRFALTPETAAADPGQQESVEENGRERRQGREGRAERAHRESEAADRHVHGLAPELARGQAGHAPISRSQATVVSSPERRLRGR